MMGQQPKKYHVTDEGIVYRVNEDGSFTEMGNAEEFSDSTLNSSHRENKTISKNDNQHSVNQNKYSWFKKSIFVIITLLIAVFLVFYFIFPVEHKIISEEGKGDLLIEETVKIEGFIESYYYYVVNGDALRLFEDENITFFDLVNVNKNQLKKRLDSSNKNVSFEFDWSTLVIHELENGEKMYVYSFDYYIHKGSRIDKYRITSEMIITKDSKIKSIRDLQTTKVNN